jgi:hypothetical protein
MTDKPSSTPSKPLGGWLRSVARLYGLLGWAERPTRAHFRAVAAWVMTVSALFSAAFVTVILEGKAVPDQLVVLAITVFGLGLTVSALSFVKWRSTPAPAHSPAVSPSARREHSPQELVDGLNLRSSAPVALSTEPAEEPFRDQIARAFELEQIRSQEITLSGDRVVTLAEVVPSLANALARWTRETEIRQQLRQVFPRPDDWLEWALDENLGFGGFTDRVLRLLRRYRLAEETRYSQSNAGAYIGVVDGSGAPRTQTRDASFSEWRWTDRGQEIANQLADEAVQAVTDSGHPYPAPLLTITGGDGTQWEKQYPFERIPDLSPAQPMYAKTLTVSSRLNREVRRCRARLTEIDPPQASVNTPVSLDWLGHGKEIDLEPKGQADVVICRAEQFGNLHALSGPQILGRRWNDPLLNVTDDPITVTVVVWGEDTPATTERFMISGMSDPDYGRVYPRVQHLADDG